MKVGAMESTQILQSRTRFAKNSKRPSSKHPEKHQSPSLQKVVRLGLTSDFGQIGNKLLMARRLSLIFDGWTLVRLGAAEMRDSLACVCRRRHRVCVETHTSQKAGRA